MLDIQRKYLYTTVAALTKMGAEFFIRIDGESFGTIKPEQILEPKVRKNAPRRDMSSFGIKEKVANIQIGEVITFLPANGFTAEEIRANVSSQMCYRYGNKSAITGITKDGVVEVMRVA